MQILEFFSNYQRRVPIKYQVLHNPSLKQEQERLVTFQSITIPLVSLSIPCHHSHHLITHQSVQYNPSSGVLSLQPLKLSGQLQRGSPNCPDRTVQTLLAIQPGSPNQSGPVRTSKILQTGTKSRGGLRESRCPPGSLSVGPHIPTAHVSQSSLFPLGPPGPLSVIAYSPD